MPDIPKNIRSLYEDGQKINQATNEYGIVTRKVEGTDQITQIIKQEHFLTPNETETALLDRTATGIILSGTGDSKRVKKVGMEKIFEINLDRPSSVDSNSGRRNYSTLTYNMLCSRTNENVKGNPFSGLKRLERNETIGTNVTSRSIYASVPHVSGNNFNFEYNDNFFVQWEGQIYTLPDTDDRAFDLVGKHASSVGFALRLYRASATSYSLTFVLRRSAGTLLCNTAFDYANQLNKNITILGINYNNTLYLYVNNVLRATVANSSTDTIKNSGDFKVVSDASISASVSTVAKIKTESVIVGNFNPSSSERDILYNSGHPDLAVIPEYMKWGSNTPLTLGNWASSAFHIAPTDDGVNYHSGTGKATLFTFASGVKNAFREITNDVIEKKYKIVAWTKTGTATIASLSVRSISSSDIQANLTKTVNPDGSGWDKWEASYIPSNVTNIGLFVILNAGSDGQTYWVDDVSVIQEGIVALYRPAGINIPNKKNLKTTTVNATTMTVGLPYEIIVPGNTDFTTCGALVSVEGARFVATSVPTGNGTVKLVAVDNTAGSGWFDESTNNLHATVSGNPVIELINKEQVFGNEIINQSYLQKNLSNMKSGNNVSINPVNATIPIVDSTKNLAYCFNPFLSINDSLGVKFASSNQRLTIPDNVSNRPGTGNFSISIPLTFPLAHTGAYAKLISKGYFDATQGYTVTCYEVASKYSIVYSENTSSSAKNANIITFPSTLTGNHLVTIAKDTVNKIIYVYLDGIMYKKISYSDVVDINTTSNIIVSQDASIVWNPNFFVFANYMFSPFDVLTLYNSGHYDIAIIPEYMKWGSNTPYYSSNFTINTDGFTSNNSTIVADTANNELDITISSNDYSGTIKNGVFGTLGLYHIVELQAKANDGFTGTFRNIGKDVLGSNCLAVLANPSMTSEYQTYKAIVKSGDTTNCSFYVLNGNGKSISIKDIKINRAGIISLYRPSGITLTNGFVTSWIDESSNSINGTVSTSGSILPNAVIFQKELSLFKSAGESVYFRRTLEKTVIDSASLGSADFLPPDWLITKVILKNSTATSYTLKIGSTVGGNEYVSSFVLPANSRLVVDMPDPGKNPFHESNFIPFYISPNAPTTNWGGVKVKLLTLYVGFDN